MSKKKKFSSRVVESVDPMSAFIDDSEELAIPEDEPASIEASAEAVAPQPTEEHQAEEPKAEEIAAFQFTEEPKPAVSAAETDVLAMLHGTEMKPKTAVLEKNALPIQLLNKEAEKKEVVVIDAPNVGKLHDLLEVARQHAAGYQPTWDASIKAYARHMGFPSMANLEDSKAFLVKWGAKLKD